MAATLETPALRFEGETQRKRGSRIARMFDRIAPTYDLLNHLLSANEDARWRRRAVERLALRGDERVLDCCTGTGDLAIALAPAAGSVVGVDFSAEMVARAREKAPSIPFHVADVTRLPFPDASFDVVTVAFGVRNLQDLDAGLREMARVLVPGGRLLVLEFTRPENPIVRSAYLLYFMLLLPLVGNLVSGGADNAYAYLPRSVLAFPGPRALAARMRAAGFGDVRMEPLSMGIAAIHMATRS
jgi:demethylmenaquinone methyltransferase/2-methoxy-6-polyprenyl-1,4-benzoquinol methylase